MEVPAWPKTNPEALVVSPLKPAKRVRAKVQSEIKGVGHPMRRPKM